MRAFFDRAAAIVGRARTTQPSASSVFNQTATVERASPVPADRSDRLGVYRGGIIAVSWSTHVSSVNTSSRAGGSSAQRGSRIARSTVHRSTIQAAFL